MQRTENPPHWDVLIVGGGIIGSATAYYLMRMDPALKIAVIEPDPTYSRASTTLSLANVRVQFSLRENIQISRYTLEVLKTFNQDTAVEDRNFDVSFKPEGNLFFVDPASETGARKSLELQKGLGCRVEWWSPEEARTRFPLPVCGGWSGATFGAEDGHLDAQSFLNGYRSKASAMGARYLRDEAVEISAESKRVQGVRLASGSILSSRCVVNCAGAWASKVALTAGIRLPIEPVKRQVFIFDPAEKPESPIPLTVLPSGLYFRSETGGMIVIGKSLNEDPVGFDFTWSEKRFLEVIWPEVAEAVPSFQTLKLIRGWAGLYAVNRLDGNAVLGEWPELRGFYLANGFSGHGLQQAPAVGRYLSELITGSPPSLDLSIFAPERILERRPVGEAGIV